MREMGIVGAEGAKVWVTLWVGGLARYTDSIGLELASVGRG